MIFLAVVYIFFFAFSTLIFGSSSSSSSSSSNRSDLNVLLSDLKINLSKISGYIDIFALEISVNLINSHLIEFEFKQNEDSIVVIKRIKSNYMLALNLILEIIKRPNNRDDFSDFLSKIVSNICEVRPIFSEFLEKDAVVEFVLKCQDLIFRFRFFYNFSKIIYNPSDVDSLLKILGNISIYLKLEENLKGHELVIIFYLYFSIMFSKLKSRDLFASSEHPKDSILFINKYQIKVDEDITTWLIIYYKNMDLIFKNTPQDSATIRILFKMIKELKDVHASDNEWAVGIFCAPNFKSLILADAAYFTIYLDLLGRLCHSFRQEFKYAVANLDPLLNSELMEILYKHDLKKKQILTLDIVNNCINNAKLYPNLPSEEAYNKWKIALQDLKKIDFHLLEADEISNLNETISKDFLNLASQYFTSNSTTILFTVNAYIPILLKFKISLNPESQNVAKNITRAIANYFYQKYLIFTDEINLLQIRQLLGEFHGEIFKDEERFTLFSTILTLLKLNPFNFKTLRIALKSEEWQNDEMFILNIQHRIIKLIQSDTRTRTRTRDEDEIKEIVEYLGSEAKVLSKTQILCYKFILG